MHLPRANCHDVGDIKSERQDHLDELVETAIQIVSLSWAKLSEAASDFDIDTAMEEPEDDTRRGYFETLKWEVLELADAIYWSIPDAARRKDDIDLEMFETTGLLQGQCSLRIQALALLTFAKELVERYLSDYD